MMEVKQFWESKLPTQCLQNSVEENMVEEVAVILRKHTMVMCQYVMLILTFKVLNTLWCKILQNNVIFASKPTYILKSSSDAFFVKCHITVVLRLWNTLLGMSTSLLMFRS